MNTFAVIALCLLFGGLVAAVVWCAWSVLVEGMVPASGAGAGLDETDNCERCGCGMVECARGWACPECRAVIEAE